MVGIGTLLVEFLFIRKLGEYLTRNTQAWSWMPRVGAGLMLTSIGVTVLATNIQQLAAQSFLLLFAMVGASLAFSVATMLAMEMQFGFGSNSTEGRRLR
ncbi:hypothetical protein CGERO_01090 [Corynebacterium gerontici]|uniref:Uncharacterized protein n=1 Tax=Corynebacterium gerontici TaxID=2079234 RepID=A0A3G6IYJ1_9CORY|nr:hypothetical protein CGERO_01090 [Corynebacterium gerontici]